MTDFRLMLAEGRAGYFQFRNLHEEQLPAAEEISLLKSNEKISIFPPAVRWISADRSSILIERPPTMMPVRYQPLMKASAKRKEFVEAQDIPLPWQQYLVIRSQLFSGKYVFCHRFVTYKPLTSLDDQLYLYPTPNISSIDGRVCMADEAKGGVEGDIATVARNMLNAIWTSGFNENLLEWNEAAPKEAPKETRRDGSGYKLMEWLSAHSVQDALQWTYREAPGKISSFVEEMAPPYGSSYVMAKSIRDNHVILA